MKTLLAFLFLFTVNVATAQHEADNWHFGVNSGISFATSPPTFLPGGQLSTLEGCSSISDSSGNLLFYSNGDNVWNSNNVIMPNGMGLIGSFTSAQSALIIPKPGSSNLFYIFTPPDQFITSPFSYSIIDMSLNGGLGDVTIKNVALLDSSTEKVTAVRHSNGIDIWVISHEFNTNSFFVYSVTASGVNATPIISSVGLVNGPDNSDKIGHLKAAPCGNKLVAVGITGGFLEIYDFNTSSGIVSNPIQIGSSSISPFGFYGAEISPDGSRLYVSLQGSYLIAQYDLIAGSASAIIASRDTVYHDNTNNRFGAIQNGPDGRMYVSKISDSSLACITNPNQLGVTCNFILNYISLNNTICRYGLPNFLTSYFCGLNVNITHPETNAISSLHPNPATTSIAVSLTTNSTTNTKITILSTLGSTVYTNTVFSGSIASPIIIPLTNFQKGIYFLHVQTNDGIEAKKFVVE